MTQNTTITNTNGETYSGDEYEMLLAARERRAALKPTPVAPQPTQDVRTEDAKRRNSSLNTRGFSLLG